MASRTRRLKAAAVIVALTAIATSSASAELTQHGDLFLNFSGGIAPNALPRHDPAPISVSLAGRIRTLSGERPPALRKVTISLNRDGRLDAKGLPLCPIGRLGSTTSKAALRTCRSSLIGQGSFAAAITFPDAAALPSHGRLLAFNARLHRRRVILIHLYGTNPLPVTRLIVFHLRHGSGSYGTVLAASLPPAVNRYGFLKRISLTLSRRFNYRGKPHSYLSATCAAPKGFRAAVFPFARAVFSFADKRELSSTAVRSCRVRG